MRIKQQISEFYRFVHLGETFLCRLYKYSVHIETKKNSGKTTKWPLTTKFGPMDFVLHLSISLRQNSMMV